MEAFKPSGPLYAVDDSASVQCLTYDNTRATAYRIVNTGAAYSYIGWGQTSGAPIVTAPVVGTPQGTNGNGIIGMIAGSVEVFSLPPGFYFKAATDGTFEVMPGEGI